MRTPDYEDIIQRGIRRRNSYATFLKTLRKDRKAPHDSLFREAHDHAFEQIDCLRCGRCCTGLGPRLSDRDVNRLASRERLKPAAWMENYLRTDEDGDMIFREMPCPFFGADGYCLIYEDRPDACRDYPHMDSGRQKTRIALHMENLGHCPAVVLGVEYLMELRKGRQQTGL